MGRKLARAVVVGLNVYRPGDEPSAEDAELITNPAAWEAPAEDEDEEVRAISPDSTPVPNDPTGGAVEVPPRSGPGSGEAAWQAWAATQPDLDVAPDAKKADIIAAAEDAGLIEKK